MLERMTETELHELADQLGIGCPQGTPPTKKELLTYICRFATEF